ncbi:LuxR C-terminal-related transcriptional regulator [uncultured Senegalimassilia sp.]|uniref:helix-turn-helix transcriptional regulator n=1 Tax=uncultured Senegalimassilia sp. TaxID=1714350 RepID=UPI0025EAE4DB|nr:LuxR C-terminal-related transcriptional regulator [uncultured Senegalimassilia sp.]
MPQFGRKGRTKSYIAETLYLTENTVRSHAKHLYTKLDVHNKQEFMDRVVRKR